MQATRNWMAVREAAKHEETFMASVLRDRAVQAVTAIQRDRARAATELVSPVELDRIRWKPSDT